MTRYWRTDGGIVFSVGPHGEKPALVGRYVVVIDPEDEAQVGALLRAYYADSSNACAPELRLRMQEGLRSLIAPPRAEVPEGGWGRNATVRDRAGHEWRVRVESGHNGRWYRVDDSTETNTWADLDVAPDGVLWEGAR